MDIRARLTRRMIRLSPLLLAAVLLFSLVQPAAADDDDPPGRVARLSFVGGSVSFEPAGESDWMAADLNRPITTADKLWTDEGARAELDLGSATIRLNSSTGLSFLNLDDRVTQIQLSEGTLNIHVDELDGDETFEVDTPNQSFSILQAGEYRVQANEEGDATLVTVRSGSGEVTGGGDTYNVTAGLSGQFSGTDYIRGDIFRAPDYDEFDRWSQDRDRREEQSQSARYVSRDVVGYQDLDNNGTWRQDPDYGDIWVPRVYAGWAPYRDGHWAWISPWGWTWVDDAPWGFAPFHYGRWVYARNNWCWVPGPRAVRPVYAPALVAFVGGPGFGLSVTFGGGRGPGNVGWFPLGPREVYVPSYNASREYVTRVNVSNTNVNNVTVINVYNNSNNERDHDRGFDRRNERTNSDIRYMNRTAPGGVTVVSRNTFAGAQPVGRAVISVNPRDISSAPVGHRADVAPTRNSVYGNSAPIERRVPRPSETVFNRTVVARTPAPRPPVSFESQQQKLAEHPGQPLQKRDLEGLRPANAPAGHPQVRQVPAGRPASVDSMGHPVNAPPANPARGVGGNPPAGNAPAGRFDRRNGPAVGQPENQPGRTSENPAPGGAPLNSPARNNAPAEQNRSRLPNPQPQPAPPANVGGNTPQGAAPVNPPNRAPANLPPARNNAPVEQNRTRLPNPQSQPAPPANVGGNTPQGAAPVNPPNRAPANLPPARSNAPVEQNRTRLPNPQSQPAPQRDDRRNESGRGQPPAPQPGPAKSSEPSGKQAPHEDRKDQKKDKDNPPPQH